jgi:hypothetical protein
MRLSQSHDSIKTLWEQPVIGEDYFAVLACWGNLRQGGILVGDHRQKPLILANPNP